MKSLTAADASAIVIIYLYFCVRFHLTTWPGDVALSRTQSQFVLKTHLRLKNWKWSSFKVQIWRIWAVGLTATLGGRRAMWLQTHGATEFRLTPRLPVCSSRRRSVGTSQEWTNQAPLAIAQTAGRLADVLYSSRGYCRSAPTTAWLAEPGSSFSCLCGVICGLHSLADPANPAICPQPASNQRADTYWQARITLMGESKHR